MCDGLRTRRKPSGYQATGGRKSQSGNKSGISGTNSNDWLHPHRRRLQQVVWSTPRLSDVPRHIAEHRLNVREGCSPVRQKKRGQAADRNQAIQEEVRKLVEA
ncbi:hypothetical protein Tco_0550186 [Tanacetum coccineum]